MHEHKKKPVMNRGYHWVKHFQPIELFYQIMLDYCFDNFFLLYYHVWNIHF